MPVMAQQRLNRWGLSGRVATGAGRGAAFTGLEWAKTQFMSSCGIDPFPGTLNLIVDRPRDQAAWREVRDQSGERITGGGAGSCDALLFPVRICDALPGAIVLPEIKGYAENQIELIAAVPVREYLSLSDGDRVDIVCQRSRRIRAAIFDVDGTLLNSLEGYRVAASRATEPYGYEVTYESVRTALNLNQPFWDFVIPADQARDEAFIAKLRDETMRHWPAVLAEHVSVLPGLEGALEELRRAGIRLGIFTGSGGESFPPLREAGILDQFEVVVTGLDVQQRKPHPEGLIKCIEQMGLNPVETAYIGDSALDVRASLAAGAMSVGVLTGAGDSASLSAAGAHRVLADIARLPGLFDLTTMVG